MTMSIEEIAAKEVLLIVRDFSPYCPSVGSALRAIKLVAWLKLQGLEPVVLHARAPEGEFSVMKRYCAESRASVSN